MKSRGEALVLVKLGGSLITDKAGEAALRRDVLRRVCQELAEVLAQQGPESRGLQILLGHGSGSFGHATAARHGIGSSPIEDQAGILGAAETRDVAAQLHREVIGELVRAGVPAVSFTPSSSLIARRGRPVRGTIDPLLRLLDGGWLPVVYGDVLVDEEWGASIASTEAVFLYLLRRLARRGRVPQRVLWLGETPGILDPEGRTVPTVRPDELSDVRRMVGGSAGTDVTGGMVLRLEATVSMAEMGVESLIFDGRSSGSLRRALQGGDCGGTRVLATPR